jgi:hypothetical protein
MKVKNQLLISKNQVIACKDALIMQVKGQPQHYTASSGPAIPGNCFKLLRQSSSSNSCSDETVALSPLDKDEMLDQLFLQVGGGEHLYIAGVSRRWRGRYIQHCVQNGTTKESKKLVTRHRSVLRTESRLQLALNCGLVVKDWPMDKLTCPDLICLHSVEPQHVMTLLKVQGVPWDAMLCARAALHSKLPLLQWLRKSACPWAELTVLYAADRCGNLAMLEWLLTFTSPWTDITKQYMISHAGWNDKLAAAQWFRARGVKWPAKITGQYNAILTNAIVHQCWSLTTVQWAVAAGSGWLDWHCEDYDEDNFSLLVAK